MKRYIIKRTYRLSILSPSLILLAFGFSSLSLHALPVIKLSVSLYLLALSQVMHGVCLPPDSASRVYFWSGRLVSWVLSVAVGTQARH